jgi:hypothetical protein
MTGEEDSFLAEIWFGGGTWKNEVFPLGKSFENVKLWAMSEVKESHAEFEVIFVKMQKFSTKFETFVDVKNLVDHVQNNDRVQVILEV